MRPRYREDKATQAAARLLKLRGGQMSHLKLIKLLYLVERETLTRFGAPLSHDTYVSMPHGPVVSSTLDRINTWEAYRGGYWDRYIAPKVNHEVRLRDPASVPEDQLSSAEKTLIDEIFSRYGQWSRWELVELTHGLPEWTDPRARPSRSLPMRSFGRRDIRMRTSRESGPSGRNRLTRKASSHRDRDRAGRRHVPSDRRERAVASSLGHPVGTRRCGIDLREFMIIPDPHVSLLNQAPLGVSHRGAETQRNASSFSVSPCLCVTHLRSWYSNGTSGFGIRAPERMICSGAGFFSSFGRGKRSGASSIPFPRSVARSSAPAASRPARGEGGSARGAPAGVSRSMRSTVM